MALATPVFSSRQYLPVIMLASCVACSYSVKGNLPSHLETVNVTPVRSITTEYGLEQELTSNLVETLVSDGRLSVVTSSHDSVLKTTISSFVRSAYSYSSAEVIEEYKLEMRVSIDFEDLVQGVPMLESESISKWIIYDPVQESYTDAKSRLIKEISEEIVRRCLSGW